MITDLVDSYKEILGLELEVDGLVVRIYKPTPKAKFTNRKLIVGNRFKDESTLLNYINEYLNTLIKIKEDKHKYKQEIKESNSKEAKLVSIGDIFHCSWGYEQTQCDLYQVIEKPSKSTIIVRPIGYETIEECSWASEYVRAIKDSFIGEETYKYRLNGSSFKISSFQYVSKVSDPESAKFYHSWYA